MPGISPIKIIGEAIFASHSLKLPTDDGWEQPQGDPNEGHYSDSLNEIPGATIPIPTHFPIPFFQFQNANKYHQDSCNDIGKAYDDFLGAALDAVKFSHDMWKLQAKFKDLKVMAVSAIGAPGCLDGPKLESNIKNAPSFASYTDDNAKEYVKAVAKGVSDQFDKWQGKVTVPGLPWYPAFAAYPGPMAAPTPNIPMPLIACVSAMMAEITVPSKLKDAMVDALDSGIKDDDPDKQHEALFDGIGTALALAFLIWLPSQQAMLVLGKGPVPSFAPPYVPVGPVVAGDNIGAPGHLMA